MAWEIGDNLWVYEFCKFVDGLYSNIKVKLIPSRN